jgi:DNA adenine methylase
MGSALDSIATLGDTREVTYPGGKNGAGVFQTIINRMPPHSVYIEPFLGGGAVMRLKRPAALNVGIDLAPGPIARFSEWARATTSTTVTSGDEDRSTICDDAAGKIAISGDAGDRWEFQQGEALLFLSFYPFKGSELVYCDPPYMHETRSRKKLYDFEMSDERHEELLRILKTLPCRVMISGYWTELYALDLASWNLTSFQAMTRGGHTATEYLWSNFPDPVALHDYRYLGTNFRERERIKRKTSRWVRRLKSMPTLERRALLHAVDIASPFL